MMFLFCCIVAIAIVVGFFSISRMAPSSQPVVRWAVPVVGVVAALVLIDIGRALDMDAQRAAADTTLRARSEEVARGFISSLGLRAAGVVCSSRRHHLPNGPVACTVGTESGTVVELSCDPDLPLTERGATCAVIHASP